MSSFKSKDRGPDTEMVRAAIQKSPVFSSLNEQEVDELLSSSELRRVQPGEVVCRPGDAGDHVALVLSGALAAEAPGRGVCAPLNRINPGEVYGEMAVLRGVRRSAQLTAIEPSDLLIVSPTVFLSLLVGHPAISIRILGTVSDRLHHLTHALSQGLPTPAPGH